MPDRVTVKPLWAPSRVFAEQSNLKKFQNRLFVKKGLYFRDYQDLWDWSVTDPEDFWESVWEFCDVKSHSLYLDVLVKPSKGLMGTEWFTGATVSYVEHVFRHKNALRPALLCQSEHEPLREVSWRELEHQVSAIAAYLRHVGVGPGDRVAAVLPNDSRAVAAFLAVNARGAVWSGCAPHTPPHRMADQFQSLEPKLLITVDGYRRRGETFDLRPVVRELTAAIPALKKTIIVPFSAHSAPLPATESWTDILHSSFAPLEFTYVPFSHPLRITPAPGEVGKTTALVHTTGGCLIEHFKVLLLHQNVKVGERYCWPATLSDPSWQLSVSSLLAGAIPVLYEGEVAFPTLHTLWELVEKSKTTHLIADASYYEACIDSQLNLQHYRFSQLQSMGIAVEPWTTDRAEWAYQSVRKDVWLTSFGEIPELSSGVAGGCPTLPVYPGELPCRFLGCKLEVYRDDESAYAREPGDMVIAQPMPSMPLGLWNDLHGQLYRRHYFETPSEVWRQPHRIHLSHRGGVVPGPRSVSPHAGPVVGTDEVYSSH